MDPHVHHRHQRHAGHGGGAAGAAGMAWRRQRRYGSGEAVGGVRTDGQRDLLLVSCVVLWTELHGARCDTRSSFTGGCGLYVLHQILFVFLVMWEWLRPVGHPDTRTRRGLQLIPRPRGPDPSALGTPPAQSSLVSPCHFAALSPTKPLSHPHQPSIRNTPYALPCCPAVHVGGLRRHHAAGGHAGRPPHLVDTHR